MTGTAATTVGVAGVGRLGEVLAVRLADRFRVVLYDADPATAVRVAERTGLTAVTAEELPARADTVLLCVPPAATADALVGLARHAAKAGRRPVFVNLATGVPGERLAERLAAEGGLDDVEVLGLKPVGQFTAIAHGVPAVFVTGDARRQGFLQRLVGELGSVVGGDEAAVGPLNRAATKAALRACERMTGELAADGTDPVLIRSAVRNVLAGTVLDHPPHPGNPYTRSVLDELAAEDRAVPPTGGGVR